MTTQIEAMKLALELKNSASAYWTEKEIPIIEKLIKLLAQTEKPAQQEPVEVQIERLQDEVVEQCRINGMSAEREDALRAEVERLNKALAAEREWVELTDAELNDLAAIHSGLPLYRAIEDKLRSKNT